MKHNFLFKPSLDHHHHQQHISYMYYTLCSSTDLTLTFEWVLAKLVYRAY